jgi:hypothetical protein
MVTLHEVQSGQTYLVKYRAKNKFGWSDYSDERAIVAAARPDKILDPKVERANLVKLEVSWTQPNSNGSPIKEINVMI